MIRKRKNSVYYIQIACQILSLLLFLTLMVIGKIQIWMGIFLLSIVLTLFFGRFYCGWLCPIRSIQRVQTAAKSRLGIKEKKGPFWLRNNIVRYLILVIFLLTMAVVLIGGRQLPVLPALLAIGVVLSFFYAESLWHRWLCPYGTILRLPASLGRKSLRIDQSKCSSCGICDTVCPGEAIDVTQPERETTRKKDTYAINKAECLLCLECVRSCPSRVISYNKSKD